MSVVLAAALAVLAFGGTGSAHAEGLLGPEVRLAATAPSTGQIVHGTRTIEGTADAAEGISRVELYVMPHSLTGSVGDHVPVATMKPALPLIRVSFAFEWDSAKTPQGLVDIVVLATTSTSRTAEARVLSLRVRNSSGATATESVARPTSASAAKTTPRRGPATRAAAAPIQLGRLARVVSRPGGSPQRLPSPIVARAQAEQATAFYAALGGLAASDAPSVRRAALTVSRDSGRRAAPTLALALVLLLAAAHTQRAVRVQLAPRD